MGLDKIKHYFQQIECIACRNPASSGADQSKLFNTRKAAYSRFASLKRTESLFTGFLK
jgi:hypothetical protein